MATSKVQESAVLAPTGQAPSTPHNAASPPSKRDLSTWWRNFTKAKKDEEKGERILL
jgi:hypothetical protein